MVIIGETRFEIRTDGSRRQLIVQGAIIGVGVTLASIAELDVLLAELTRERKEWAAETASDPYTILEVSRTASKKEIRDAYRKRARAVHPDKHGGDDEHMKRLNAAYAAIVAAHHP